MTMMAVMMVTLTICPLPREGALVPTAEAVYGLTGDGVLPSGTLGLKEILM